MMTTFLKHQVSEPTYFPQSASDEHAAFAMWLVRSLQPKRIVQFGTHNGYSYFAMCQAVKEAGLSSECFAVDTWREDAHADDDLEAIYARVSGENRKYEQFSTLLRKTFYEALEDIEDGSVDLLHIDGRHFYPDIKRGFDHWAPKLSKRAVVLFHNTMKKEPGFGVEAFWADISQMRPSFNFSHCNGLGVLFWGGEVPSQLVDLVKLSTQNGGPGVVESFFETAAASMLKSARLRDLEKQNANLQNMLIFSEKYTKVITHNHSQAATMLQRHIDHLTTHLVDARSRPLEQLNRLVAGRVLRKLAKASPPLPKKTVTRFAGSAKKRDPARAEILSQQPSQAYDDIVEAWARQRAEMADRNEGLVKRLQNKVLFSVIVSVHNPNPNFVQKMITSVKEQSYVNWQLCIADESFHDQRIREILQAAADADPRIEIVLRDANVYMSHVSNSAIERAKGDYIVFLDHEDVLDPDALLYVAECIDRKPDAKIIYTDEDRIREDGSRYEPHFKPDWNRELLYSYNYISHLTTYTSDIIKKIGGFRPGYEGAQDYDLLLRCLPHVTDAQIQHIPKVLYSWRSSPDSIEHTADAKPYAWEAGVRAVTEALSQSCNAPMTVELGPYPFTYIPQWPLPKEPSVSIIIPTRDRLDITRVTVETILEKTDYKNYDIIIIDNGSTEPETLAWFAEISKSMPVSILRDDGPFNYSALNNRAVAQSKGEIIALVNNDIEIISAGWLREMVSLAVRPSIGCVGAKLYYPDNTIQHAGVVVGLSGAAGHSLKGLFREDPGYFMRVVLRQEYTAVTGACLVIRRNIFEEVGGLNAEHLTVGFNDVDFCLKVHAAGYRNLWTPLAEMYHHESASRKADDTPEKIARAKREVQYMVDTWRTDTYEDTAYNPNLTKLFEDFRFGPARWEYGSCTSSE